MVFFVNRGMAFDWFKRELVRRGWRVVRVKPYNRGRHVLIDVEKDGVRDSYYVLFKKDSFHSFNYEFKDFVRDNPDFSGHGESINVEYNHVAVCKFATLVFVYEDGRAYWVSPKLVSRFCEKYNLVREQDRENAYQVADYSGVKQIVRERTFSFPFKLLNRWL